MNGPQIESDSRTPSGTSASSATIIETSYSRGENDSVMPRDGIHRSTSRGAFKRKESRVGALQPRVTRVYHAHQPCVTSPLVDTALLPERDPLFSASRQILIANAIARLFLQLFWHARNFGRALREYSRNGRRARQRANMESITLAHSPRSSGNDRA